jgi:hypothetical protein
MVDTREIQLTQGMSATVDATDYEWLSSWRWRVYRSKSGTYYAFRTGSDAPCVQMHKAILESKTPVDHINGNGLDNRRLNLRPATYSQNACNRRLSTRSTSGYKGVCFHKGLGKWWARIMLEGTRLDLGYYTDPIDAAIAYNAAALELHGAFALLNEIPDRR